MSGSREATAVLVIGGGMITHDQLLPSLFELQRLRQIGDIGVCSRHAATLSALADSPILKRAFPGQSFQQWTAPTAAPAGAHSYRETVASLPPRQIVVVALPDHLHFDAILHALRSGQHVISVKPMVLTAQQSRLIEEEAFERGLVVGIDYHKRFDTRNLMARRQAREGRFGNFRIGSAALFEKWYYRHSNFQNWCTAGNSDVFTYIGCHYVDLVHFITGLLPTSVSVAGIREQYPNGNEGYLWTDARVRWENGAILNVQNGLGYPDDGPGGNAQGLRMYFSNASGDRGSFLFHDDQYRGVGYSALSRPPEHGATVYSQPNPDYFEYLDTGGPGLTPSGYGFRSIAWLVQQCLTASAMEPLSERRKFLESLDEAGVMATPANSRFNEAVIEAARRSLAQDGKEEPVQYSVEQVAAPGSGKTA